MKIFITNTFRSGMTSMVNKSCNFTSFQPAWNCFVWATETDMQMHFFLWKPLRLRHGFSIWWGFFLLPIICFFVPNNYVQTFFWWTRKQISSNCVSVLDYAGCNAASCVNQKSFKLCWRRNQFPQFEELCNAIMQGGRKVWKSLGPGGTVMRTFQTNIKCNNINHVRSHFYEILVVLKYYTLISLISVEVGISVEGV